MFQAHGFEPSQHKTSIYDCVHPGLHIYLYVGGAVSILIAIVAIVRDSEHEDALALCEYHGINVNLDYSRVGLQW